MDASFVEDLSDKSTGNVQLCAVSLRPVSDTAGMSVGRQCSRTGEPLERQRRQTRNAMRGVRAWIRYTATLLALCDRLLAEDDHTRSD